MCRHDLSDEEWAVIEPLLPRDTRGVPRVDGRRVINGHPLALPYGLAVARCTRR